MPLPFPFDSLQDLNQDGVIDYVNIRIYVADRPTPAELAAAANVAARFAFESLSLDLPIGGLISDYETDDDSVAIVVGSAAERFTNDASEEVIETRDGPRHVICIPSSARAESWATSLGFRDTLEGDGGTTIDEEIPAKDYSLSQLFSTRGLLGDSTGDFIPDRTETKICIGPDCRSPRVIDLAARIALESTGLTLPLVMVAGSRRNPRNPVFVGVSNPHVQRFVARGQLKTDLEAGEGRIQIVPNNARRNGIALVIFGGDDKGEDAALRHAAETLPYAWQYGKERLHLNRIDEDLRRFFSLRSPEAQTAFALYAARHMARKLEGRTLESAGMQIFLEGSEEGLLEFFRKEFKHLDAAARNIDVRSAETVFEETFTMDWEVDQAREKVTTAVLPAVQMGSAVTLELRLSESPEIRKRLSEELRETMLDRGADPARTEIRVLPAHKQAYGWIDEVLKPQLKGMERIDIYFLELDTSDNQCIESPIRWLQELYPIDETLARDLGIPLNHIGFEKTATGPTYRVKARNDSGTVCLDESFEPRTVSRPMFDKFPDYARVLVATGWIQAEVDGSTMVNERIPTDPERFWDQYQSQTLSKIHDYILELYGGSPRRQVGPHFGSLEVDVTLSEPDYRIGVDEERISTLEALHEDIYFETILFFDVLGRHYAGKPLLYPGRIIPRIRPSSEGRPPAAQIRFTGKPVPGAAVDLGFQEPGTPPQRWRRYISPIEIEAPKIQGLTVRTGHDPVVSLDILQKIDVPRTPDAALIEPGTSESSDLPKQLSVEQAEVMLENIREIHELGYGLEWLSWEGIEKLHIRMVDSRGIATEIELPQATAGCYSTPKLEASRDKQEPLMGFQGSLDSTATHRIITELARFPEVHPFYTSHSYLDTPIWALDVMSSLKGKFFSQAKATVMKPVLLVTGRQHGNEVSSTSHILKLVELLVSDPRHKSLLERVNFVIQPMTNPDGADLAHELAKDTPDFMLHAGYFGALGVDVIEGQWSDDPIYPEASVRRKLWEMWLPDIVLDAHGYPSHEWVQLFAGYSAWVQGRSTKRRDWWIPRGCFVPHFNYVDSLEHPDHRDTAFGLRDHLAAAIRVAAPEINERMCERYEKYGRWDPDTYQTSFHNQTLIYSEADDLRHDGKANSFMTRYPQVTVFAGTIEVPDETARGKWFELVADVGLRASLAHAEFLAGSGYTIERRERRLGNDTILTIRRKRPVLASAVGRPWTTMPPEA